MGTNHSFLLQIWLFLGCCGSLQHNSCKSLVVRVVVVAKWRKCEKSVKIIWILEKDALYLHQEKC
jgi:hypothetical protein